MKPMDFIRFIVVEVAELENDSDTQNRGAIVDVNGLSKAEIKQKYGDVVPMWAVFGIRARGELLCVADCATRQCALMVRKSLNDTKKNRRKLG